MAEEMPVVEVPILIEIGERLALPPLNSRKDRENDSSEGKNGENALHAPNASAERRGPKVSICNEHPDSRVLSSDLFGCALVVRCLDVSLFREHVQLRVKSEVN